jgi:transcriptional regulator with XRE-family HTH domain
MAQHGWNHSAAIATTPDGTAQRFGDLLRFWRERQGYSQSELGRKLGSNHSYISRMESGTRIPSRDMVLQLADILYLTGPHRVMFVGTANYLEHQLTDAQASYIAGYNDRFTHRYDTAD